MEKLRRAPIDEVVVGFLLGSSGLDPVEVGRYWSKRADVFKKHEIHEPIVAPISDLEVIYPRAWLVSEDEAWLVQLQNDRFIANWRRRSNGAYPGFTSPNGVKEFALNEFKSYLDFLRELRGPGTPTPLTVELSKIDVLIQGEHWSTIEELVALVPALAPASTLVGGDPPGPALSVVAQQQHGTATVAFSAQAARMRTDPNQLAYRLDFKATAPINNDVAGQLDVLSKILNDVFARAIPDHQRRFGDA